MLKRLALATALLGAAIGGATQLPATAAESGPKVVVDRLNNPRQLFFHHGRLYIAEAGKGGTSCFNGGPEIGEVCYGLTSTVTRYYRGHKRRIAKNILSFAGRDGTFATGVDDVSVDPDGRKYVIVAGSDQGPGAGLSGTAKRQAGSVLRLARHGRKPVVAEIDKFEFAHDPDKQGKDSNPYSLVARRGKRIYVADAGGNDLLRVHGSHVSLATVFPNLKKDVQSVPTSVRRGPDGAYYVGELTGGNAPARKARVWRVIPGHSRTVFRAGFNSITGIAFGPDASLYVCEFSTGGEQGPPSGRIVRVRPNGKRTAFGEGSLFFPGGVAVSRNGSVYVSNWSTLPAATAASGPWGGAHGQVVRFTRAQAGG